MVRVVALDALRMVCVERVPPRRLTGSDDPGVLVLGLCKIAIVSSGEMRLDGRNRISPSMAVTQGKTERSSALDNSASISDGPGSIAKVSEENSMGDL